MDIRRIKKTKEKIRRKVIWRLPFFLFSFFYCFLFVFVIFMKTVKSVFFKLDHSILVFTLSKNFVFKSDCWILKQNLNFDSFRILFLQKILIKFAYYCSSLLLCYIDFHHVSYKFLFFIQNYINS